MAFAIMLAVLMRQARTVEEATRLQGDSITSLTFQLEREFLRLRSELALTLHGRSHPDWEAVMLRYDIFLSRIELLRDNPSTIKLRTTGIPGADAADRAVDHQATPLFSNAELHADALEALLERLDRLGPTCRRYPGFASSLVVAGLIEENVRVVNAQSAQIRWLIGAQVLLLLLAATGLLLQRRQEQEQAKLQALNAELAAARDQAEGPTTARALPGQHRPRAAHPFNGMLGMLDMLGEPARPAASANTCKRPGTRRSTCCACSNIPRHVRARGRARSKTSQNRSRCAACSAMSGNSWATRRRTRGSVRVPGPGAMAGLGRDRSRGYARSCTTC